MKGCRDSRSELALLDEQIARVQARLDDVVRERGQLEQDLAGLRGRRESIARAEAASSHAHDAPSTRSAADKVALFRSLFAGRADVFPKHWHNPKSDRKGYSPACSNEWVKGVCDKPRVKCGECPNQAFIPVTDRVILDHLQGRHVAGVYPMLDDETCHFLAVDFDKDGWKDDVAAFVETCHRFDVPAAVERSRSGNGAHVWFFFGTRVPAVAARKMGCFLLTETMARRHELSMSSYDRLFPNQDTMPRGGFGNLIALPLQHQARALGNTEFLDTELNPHPDQWAYLESIERIEPTRVESLARRASETGQVIGVPMAEDEESETPWLRLPSRRRKKVKVDGPLPPNVKAVLGSQVFVETDGLPSALVNQIKRIAAFQNPEFYKKQAMRLSTVLTPRVINCAEDLPKHVGLPRGCLDALQELLTEHQIELALQDERTDGNPLDLKFNGSLTDLQKHVVRALLPHDFGVFVAPPGTGKTVVGTHLIAARARATLVLVHRTQLLDQWRAQLALFLDVKPSEIGQIGGGKRKANGRLDVAMIQSLVRRDEVDDLVSTYGHVVVDECHHVPAVSFERVMRETRARYVTGLTATPQRRDGHHPILQFQLGPVRFSIDPRGEAAKRRFEHRLIVRDTAFTLGVPEPSGIQEIYGRIAADPRRNEQILDDVVRALDEGRSPVLLTERREHLDYFAERLKNLARHLVVLQGGMGVKQRREVVAQLASIPDGEERLLLATGRFLGEGFDDARLDTLFLAMPVSWKGTLVQYAGRLHRRHDDKTEVRIYDYVDRNVPMLARMFDKRMKGYRSMGYSLGGEDSRPDDDPVQECIVEYDQGILHQLEDAEF